MKIDHPPFPPVHAGGPPRNDAATAAKSFAANTSEITGTPPTEGPGKSSAAPAFLARQAVIDDPELANLPFGHVVSQIARGVFEASVGEGSGTTEGDGEGDGSTQSTGDTDGTDGDGTASGDTDGDDETASGDTDGDGTASGDTGGDGTAAGDTDGDGTASGDTDGDGTAAGDTDGDETASGDTDGDDETASGDTGGDTTTVSSEAADGLIAELLEELDDETEEEIT